MNERPLRGTETSQEQPPPPAEETAEEEEPEVKKPPPSVPVQPGVAPPPKAQFLETARQKLKKVDSIFPLARLFWTRYSLRLKIGGCFKMILLSAPYHYPSKIISFEKFENIGVA